MKTFSVLLLCIVRRDKFLFSEKIFKKIFCKSKCGKLSADGVFYEIFPLIKGERCTFSFPKRKSSKKKLASRTLDRYAHQLSRKSLYCSRKYKCPVVPITSAPEIKRLEIVVCRSVGCDLMSAVRTGSALSKRDNNESFPFCQNIYSEKECPVCFDDSIRGNAFNFWKSHRRYK